MSEHGEDTTMGLRSSKSRSFHWMRHITNLECSHWHVVVSILRKKKASGLSQLSVS